MGQLLQKNGYLLSALVLAASLAGCEQIENTPPTQNDSLAVIPVGPGTRPGAVAPPDTPVSADSVSPGDARLP